jgi:hypothetical protein
MDAGKQSDGAMTRTYAAGVDDRSSN